MNQTKQPVSDVLVKMSGGLVVLAIVLVFAGMLGTDHSPAVFGLIIGGIGFALGLAGMVMHQFNR
jgi:formate/nitrite transporter FocA (FNT family)